MFLCLKKVIIAFLLGFSMISYSQVVSSFLSSREGATTNVVNSPTASAFRVFGSFPASNFIGVTDINISIYSLKNVKPSFPISMRYHNGMGNKVETMPSILGLGWHLDVGGAITMVDNKKRTGYPGELVRWGSFDLLNREDWSSQTFLQRLIGGPTGRGRSLVLNNVDESLQGTVYSVNFNGYSGELYFDHNDNPKFRSKDNVVFKVEIERGTRKTTTNTIRLETIKKLTLIDPQGVKYEFGGDDSAIEFVRMGHTPLKVPRDIVIHERVATTWNLTKIIHPTGELIELKYIKQGKLYTSKVWSSLKFDLWRNGSINSLFGQSTVFVNNEQATSTDKIYLDEIVSLAGRIKFSYSLKPQIKYSYPNYDRLHSNTNIGGGMEGYVSDQVNIKQMFFFNYEESGYGNFANMAEPLKQLDLIEIYDIHERKNTEVQFDYFTSNLSRPLLKSMELKSLDGQATNTTQGEKYEFKYKNTNGVLLPPYQSYSKDDYGFYSHKRGYLGFLEDAYEPKHSFESLLKPFLNDELKRNQYVENRKPEISQYNDLQLLEEITYPTGGITKFEYEPNMYGGIAKNYPFTVETNLNQIAKPAGGVRIKSVKSFDTNGTMLKSTSYKYVKDYHQGGNASSGVLTHIPTHFEFIKGNYMDGTVQKYIDYFNWNSDDIYPADRLRGNHITYSEVTEIDDKDGSFVTYKYKNFDNGYHDQPILNYAAHHDKVFKDEFGMSKDFWKKKDVISMGLERGQLLSKKYFKPILSTTGNRGEKVKEIVYQYNDKSNRFEDNIRVINAYDNHLLSPVYIGDISSYTYIASLIYTYTPYLTKETEIDYNGTASIVKKETSYKYNDTYKTVVEKEEKIGDKIYKTDYKYPFDYIYPSVYINMEKKNMISPVILEEKYIDGEKVFSQKNNYDTWFLSMGWRDLVLNSTSEPEVIPQNNVSKPPGFLLGNLPVLRNIEKQNKQGDWEKEVDFLSYDLKYNLVSSKDKTGFETSYIWGYNRSLPIWVIANASYYSISDLLGDKISKIGSDLVPLEADVQAVNTLLKQSSDLKEAVINHYLYDPIKGLIYKENERGGKEYYEYDGFGRLIKAQDGKKNTLIEYEYNYKQ